MCLKKEIELFIPWYITKHTLSICGLMSHANVNVLFQGLYTTVCIHLQLSLALIFSFQIISPKGAFKQSGFEIKKNLSCTECILAVAICFIRLNFLTWDGLESPKDFDHHNIGADELNCLTIRLRLELQELKMNSIFPK